jgi:Protein of unknown function (DUF2505)
VHFQIENDIAAPRAVVEGALGEPSFYETFASMPDVAPPTLIERTESDEAVEVRIRCAFTGQLSGAVTSVVDPTQLSWVSVITLRPGTHAADVVLVPDHYADRLECSGHYRFEDDGSGTTKEVIEGDLVVHFPLVASKIEQAILSGVERYLRDEATAMERWAVGRS